MLRFIEHVKHEFRRVTWPTWSEVKITTLLVLGIAFVMSLFFMFVDRLAIFLIGFLSF